MVLKKEFVLLWNHAAIKILDVRHIVLAPKEIMSEYKLPASMFLYSTRGSAEVQLDFTRYTIEGFQLIHGGKGSILKIASIGKEFEYYMIFYRASIPSSANRMLTSLLQKDNPFQHQYSFVPSLPIPLFEKVRSMNTEWKNSQEIEKLTVKSLFYQFINEIFIQLYQEQGERQEPSFSALVKKYIEENYSEPITLESIAQSLSYSASYLSVQFKQSTGSSPIDYLIQVRIEKASILLVETDTSLREIAASVGYRDVYYFSRLFKKRIGVSPDQFRRKEKAFRKVKDSPLMSERYSIADTDFQRYIENDYQYFGRKYQPMNTKSKSPIAALFLCFTLLLSACSGGTAGTNSANEEIQTSSKQIEAQLQTKTVSTVKGDIEVPINPQRVVVMYYTGDVLALGVKPVGSSNIQKGAVFEKELATTQDLGEWFEPNAEAVLALNPDVIIVPSEEVYDILHGIAPTIYLPYGEMSVDERINKLGEVLGKGGEAQVLLDDFYAKVEESKQKLKEAGILEKTVSIMEGGKGTMTVISNKQYGRGSQVIYEYLGMKGPEPIQQKIKNEGEEIEIVSLEKLPEFAGDYVFRSSYEGMADLSDHPVWNSIPAIKEGRLIEIDFGLSYYNDIYSLGKQLDFVVESLLATVK